MRRSRGVTLLELMISLSLFSIVTTIVAQCLVMGYRAHIATTDRMQTFRHASIALDEMGRQLRYCVDVLSPHVTTPNLGTVYKPGPGTRFTFTYNASVGKVTVSYWLDKADDADTGNLRRAGGSGDPPDGRILAEGISDFEIIPNKEPIIGWCIEAHVILPTTKDTNTRLDMKARVISL